VSTPKGGRGNAKAAANGHIAPGAVLAERYRLEERVAAGGMGEVWRATDLLLERSVAVKLLRESLAEDPIVAERFRREALLAAQVSHPNMAGVYDYVQGEGRPGIVMEFVEGETLAQRLAREGHLSVADSVRVADGILSALRSAHETGIIHRDVKPGNVMLTANGGVKVTDFGIARAVTDHTLTETGAVIGTAHYLSPEQVAGRQATPASDLYSVGAVMYEMLAGKKPFEAETPIAAAMKRLTEEPPPVRSVRKDVPEAVARVVSRALVRDPAERYVTADEMRQALDDAVDASTPATSPGIVLDPAPTEVLPLGDLPGAPDERGSAAETRVIPGVVAERRKREYKRLIGYLALFALGIGLLTVLILAIAGAGTDVVAVPDFKGMTYEAAKARADDLGFVATRSDRPSAAPAGTVVSQSIQKGTRLASGQPLTLFVSTGTPPGVKPPDVVGMELDKAKRTLEEANFEVNVFIQPTSEFDAGKVFKQDPGPDEMAQPGQTVDIFVASEPPRKHGKGKGGD
jgi:eukaryotic-like serine/threonine-protein kinase